MRHSHARERGIVPVPAVPVDRNAFDHDIVAATGIRPPGREPQRHGDRQRQPSRNAAVRIQAREFHDDKSPAKRPSLSLE